LKFSKIHIIPSYKIKTRYHVLQETDYVNVDYDNSDTLEINMTLEYFLMIKLIIIVISLQAIILLI